MREEMGLSHWKLSVFDPARKMKRVTLVIGNKMKIFFWGREIEFWLLI